MLICLIIFFKILICICASFLSSLEARLNRVRGNVGCYSCRMSLLSLWKQSFSSMRQRSKRGVEMQDVWLPAQDSYPRRHRGHANPRFVCAPLLRTHMGGEM